jgi:hypothetical protein
MSFDLTEVRRLEAAGGAVLAHYERLLREANQSAHGSLSELALGQFQLAWIADPEAVTRAAEEEGMARNEQDFRSGASEVPASPPKAEDAAPGRRRSRSSVSERGETP